MYDDGFLEVIRFIQNEEVEDKLSSASFEVIERLSSQHCLEMTYNFELKMSWFRTRFGLSNPEEEWEVVRSFEPLFHEYWNSTTNPYALIECAVALFPSRQKLGMNDHLKLCLCTLAERIHRKFGSENHLNFIATIKDECCSYPNRIESIDYSGLKWFDSLQSGSEAERVLYYLATNNARTTVRHAIFSIAQEAKLGSSWDEAKGKARQECVQIMRDSLGTPGLMLLMHCPSDVAPPSFGL